MSVAKWFDVRRRSVKRARRAGATQARPRLAALEDRTVPANLYALTSTGQILRFDSANPGTIVATGAVTGLGANESLVGIDFRPRTGQLYGSTVTTGSAANSIITTYTINPLTFQATLVGATAAALAGAGDVPTGFDFNPTVDRIRYVNTNDENARLNPNNGALAGNDTDLTPASTSDIIGEAYDRNFDRQSITTPAPNNVIPTTLYAINRSTSQLAIQGGINGTPSPNAGVITDIGALGFTLSAVHDGGFDIAPGQGAFAALTDAADNLTRLYRINLATGQATSVGLIGNGATFIHGLSIQPDGLVVTGAGPGGGAHVIATDAFTGATRFSFFAFDNFSGGVRVASGDVTGDGIADIVAGAGPGGTPHVRVFDGVTGGQIAGPLGSFLAYDAAFGGGVFVAVGDVTADGFDDIITGAGAGGGPHVRVVNGATGAEIRSFFAYDAAFAGGVRVGAGDVNGDALADVITGAGPGGGPHVLAFSGADNGTLASFFAYTPAFGGGVFVAGDDVNGDAFADIITGADAGGGPHVLAYDGKNVGNILTSFFAYDPSLSAGVRVSAADVNADGRPDIITGPGSPLAPTVRVFDVPTQTVLRTFSAYDPAFLGGVFVGGG